MISSPLKEPLIMGQGLFAFLCSMHSMQHLNAEGCLFCLRNLVWLSFWQKCSDATCSSYFSFAKSLLPVVETLDFRYLVKERNRSSEHPRPSLYDEDAIQAQCSHAPALKLENMSTTVPWRRPCWLVEERTVERQMGWRVERSLLK